MNRLSVERRVLILRCLTDGCSLRAASRITGHARNTISKLLADAGGACAKFQALIFQDLPCERIELDEVWNFVGCKQKSLSRGKIGLGSVWTWIAFDPISKIVPVWRLGDRTDVECRQFTRDVANRLKSRCQITSDGHEGYLEAVDQAFGGAVDYGMLVKMYSGSRYAGSEKKVRSGYPNISLISTSGVERQNLEMRMNMRRYTRKTNAFSKSLRFMKHAVALHFMVYNFAKIHGTLQISPAMAAGVSPTLWELADVVRLISN